MRNANGLDLKTKTLETQTHNSQSLRLHLTCGVHRFALLDSQLLIGHCSSFLNGLSAAIKGQMQSLSKSYKCDS